MIFFISVDISIYAGVFFFFIYLFKKIFKRQTETLTLANAVIIILAGASIVGGVKVSPAMRSFRNYHYKKYKKKPLDTISIKRFLFI